jgi:hypothetical protein
MNVNFWDTVVTNLAPIIIALTGFGAMAGGFYIQYRMMKSQNERIDKNAQNAAEDRAKLKTDIATIVKNGKP